MALPADIYVINYDGVRIPGVADKIIDIIGPKSVVFDESHRQKSVSTQQWTSCKKIADKCDYVYQLTGTPITQNPTDIWAQFQILVPGFFPHIYAFEHEYCKFQSMLIPIRGGGKRAVRKYIGPRHASELAEKVAVHALRKTAKECLDLPQTIRQVIKCELTSDQRKHYNAFLTTLTTHIEDCDGNDKQVLVDYASALVQKLRQVCQGFIYSEDKKTGIREITRLKSGKIEMLLDLLEDLQGEKVVILTDFIEDRVRLFDEIDKANTGHVPIMYGGEFSERDDQLRRFRVTGEASCLIANIQSASEGIDLSVANNAVYFGNTYSYAVRTQSEARCIHPEKRTPVTLYDLIVPNTPDDVILKILSMKSETAANITGDKIRLARILTGRERL
jgi:SWI/SNF-related matrix-associated actin-dependent regulator 1 of chromatin subfamily A